MQNVMDEFSCNVIVEKSLVNGNKGLAEKVVNKYLAELLAVDFVEENYFTYRRNKLKRYDFDGYNMIKNLGVV